MRKPPALNAPVVKTLLKYVGRGHVAAYRATRGVIGGQFRLGSALLSPVPVLLLDHVGRTSGKTHTTPLLFLEDGPNVVIVASSGGMDAEPQWYRNLMANPDTTVQIGGQRRDVHARKATQAQRKRLWPRLVDLYADFASYQEWTDREIPVVICEPR